MEGDKDEEAYSSERVVILAGETESADAKDAMQRYVCAVTRGRVVVA